MEREQKLKNIIDSITDVDRKTESEALEYCNSLLKIPMSLGKLELMAVKEAAITGKVHNELKNKCIIIMSADNGIVNKGVSSAPQSVTQTMTECFTKYVTGVGVIAKTEGAKLFVYDIGVNADIKDEKVINKKVRYGTADMSEGPAMERSEAVEAMLTGIEAVKTAIDKGYDIIGTGEMGIGNTSTSTAVICALSGSDIEAAVGKGTGMTDDEAYTNKVKLIKQSIQINSPDKNDPIDVVAKVGGLDIAAMAGIFLGCAYYKVPVIIDGYISSAAFYAAYKLNPLVINYAFESHKTEEVGYKIIQKELKLDPPFDLNMRLGEGSGCPFTFFALDCANSMMNHMYTFEQGMISSEYTDKINDLKF